jgi:hypothetical protein
MGLATVVAALILLTDHLVAYSVFIGRLIYGDWADRVMSAEQYGNLITIARADQQQASTE